MVKNWEKRELLKTKADKLADTFDRLRSQPSHDKEVGPIEDENEETDEQDET